MRRDHHPRPFNSPFFFFFYREIDGRWSRRDVRNFSWRDRSVSPDLVGQRRGRRRCSTEKVRASRSPRWGVLSPSTEDPVHPSEDDAPLRWEEFRLLVPLGNVGRLYTGSSRSPASSFLPYISDSSDRSHYTLSAFRSSRRRTRNRRVIAIIWYQSPLAACLWVSPSQAYSGSVPGKRRGSSAYPLKIAASSRGSLFSLQWVSYFIPYFIPLLFMGEMERGACMSMSIKILRLYGIILDTPYRLVVD